MLSSFSARHLLWNRTLLRELLSQSPQGPADPKCPPQPSIGRSQSVYMHMEPDPTSGPDHLLPTTPKLYKCLEAMSLTAC